MSAAKITCQFDLTGKAEGQWNVVVTNADGQSGTLPNRFTVNRAPATVTLAGLAQTYDGTARSVTATTDPEGLAVSITYDSGAAAPTNAGTYAISATVTDPNYTGTATGTLTIGQAGQAITFTSCPLPRKAIGQPPFALAATATSGLPVTFASSNLAVATVAGSTVTLVGAGTTTITASQPGAANWGAATPVTCDLTVLPVTADFVIASIRLDPVVPAIGSTFTAYVTVQNVGTKSASGGYLYAWLDRPAEAPAGLAGDKSAAVGTVLPGQTKMLRLTSLKAGTTEGVRTFRAFVDAKNVTAEIDETNNQATLAWHPGRPDFIVTRIAFLPEPPAVGKTFTAYVTVKNAGESAGDAGYTEVWTDAPAAVVPSLSLRGSKVLTTGTLLPAQEKTLTFTSLTAPSDAAEKTFRAVIDSRIKTVESDESNNQLTRTYQPARPDFVITSVAFSPNPVVCGKTFTVYVTVRNAGLAAGDSVYVDVLANRAAAVVAGTSVRGDKYAATGILQPNQEKALVLTSLIAGTGDERVLRVLVDGRAHVIESDETNNQSATSYFCQPLPPPAP